MDWGAARAAQKRMLYQAYQAHSDIMVPVRAFAGAAVQACAPLNGFSGRVLKNLTAALDRRPAKRAGRPAGSRRRASG